MNDKVKNVSWFTEFFRRSTYRKAIANEYSKDLSNGSPAADYINARMSGNNTLNEKLNKTFDSEKKLEQKAPIAENNVPELSKNKNGIEP